MVVSETSCPAVGKHKKIVAGVTKVPNWKNVWLKSLHKSKDTGGYMVQFYGLNGVGKGQKIEEALAKALGVYTEKQRAAAKMDAKYEEATRAQHYKEMRGLC